MADSLIFTFTYTFAGPSATHRLGRAWLETHDAQPAPAQNKAGTTVDAKAWQSHSRVMRSADPDSLRWAITFTVIALLVIAFGSIAIWGFTHSDWLYGTYGGISPTQWDEITDLREQLRQLDIAPDAGVSLDDALLVPRPSTEQVLNDLKRALLSLAPYADDPTTLHIQGQLQSLIGQIKPGYANWSPTPAYQRPTSAWDVGTGLSRQSNGP